MKIKLSLLIAIGLNLMSFAMGSSAFAAYTPLAFSIAPPVQFPPDDFSITGVRASVLWGKHRDMYGLDFGGIGNITEQSFVGIGVAGGFNATHGSTSILGLQAAGIANYNTNKTSVYGLQLAGLFNYNSADSSIYGVQLSLANLSKHTSVYGLQVGIYNKAKVVYGLQIGVVNMADSLYGVQIGLINFNETGVFKISPFLNIGF